MMPKTKECRMRASLWTTLSSTGKTGRPKFSLFSDPGSRVPGRQEKRPRDLPEIGRWRSLSRVREQLAPGKCTQSAAAVAAATGAASPGGQGSANRQIADLGNSSLTPILDPFSP